jgi:hypothetical protein
MSLVALLGGILNSLHRFTAAAAAPIVLNVVMIAVLAGVLLAGLGRQPVQWPCAGLGGERSRVAAISFCCGSRWAAPASI